MMTAEQLKNSIYQLAIQGKLVEQCDSDGNAVDLVYEIEKKKKSLLKNGEIKLIKGIEPIDEVPFDIPENWMWVRLGSIVSIISDGTHRTPNYVENGIPFLSVQNISQGYFDMTKAKYITPDEHKELIKRCKPEKDDILVCRIGTLGKAIKVSVDFEFSIFVSLGLIRLIDTRLVDYVICVINSGYGKKWIDEVKVGGGTHTNKINLKSFPNFLIPLPPLNEQVRILEKLDEFISLLSEYAATSTKLNTLNASFPEMMKKSILQEAVQGKLVPQDPNDEPASALLGKIAEEKKRLIKEGKIKKQKPLPGITEEEIPFDIPESWEWTRMGELITYQNGYAYKSSDMTDHGFPVIKSGNLMTLQVVIKPNNDYIANPTEKMLDSKIVKGDMLMCLSSQSNNPEPLGKTAIYSFDEPALLNQRVLKMRPIDERLTVYLYYAINSEYFHYTVSHQGGGSAQANLKLEHVLNMLIPVPPIKEQERIVVQLQKVFPNLSVLKRQVV